MPRPSRSFVGLTDMAPGSRNVRPAKPLNLHGVHTLIADLADSGQTFNTLTIHSGFRGYADGRPRSPSGAVVHFAAIHQ
jgi:hypothetical protein